MGFQPVSEGGHLACQVRSSAQTPGWKPRCRDSQDGYPPFPISKLQLTMDPDLDPTDGLPSRADLARELLLYKME